MGRRFQDMHEDINRDRRRFLSTGPCMDHCERRDAPNFIQEVLL